MSKQKLSSLLNQFYPEFTGLIVFITYLLTVGHYVGENDAGELTMSQFTLSIPHPTGYPLFIILGFLFSKLPLSLKPAFQLNLLNSIWCALTIVIVIRISAIIINNLNLLLNKNSRFYNELNKFKEKAIIFPSIFTGLMLAYSATFWLQSTRVEVYSLQIFISSLIIYFSIKIIIEFEKEISKNAFSWFDIVNKWKVIFILLGFGFSNHMMTLYFLPALFIIFFSYHKISFESIKALASLLTITGIIAVAFYLGLMMMAKASPSWSYGDPSSLKRLYEHVSAKEYSKLMMSGINVVSAQGAKLLKMLSFNFSSRDFSAGEFALSFLLGIAGLSLIFLFKKNIIIYFLLTLVTAIILALSYNIPDINEYFLIPFMIISLLSLIPVYIILNISFKKPLFRWLSSMFFITVIIIEFIANYNYANRSDSETIEEFFKSAVTNLPVNSVLLTDSWGLFMSPGLYVQNVEKIRTDVKIISPAGMILHEWYRKFQNFDVLDSNRVIRKIDDLYITYDVLFNSIQKGVIFLPPGTMLIPQSYYYKVVYNNSYIPMDSVNYNIVNNINSTIPSDEQIATLIPFMLDQRIQYELSENRYNMAAEYYKIIRKKFSNYVISKLTYIELMKKDLL